MRPVTGCQGIHLLTASFLLVAGASVFQYFLLHRHLQNVFELALSQRPSECTPRLPEAALSTEHAALSSQLQP
jgi:hypothetical protein